MAGQLVRPGFVWLSCFVVSLPGASYCFLDLCTWRVHIIFTPTSLILYPILNGYLLYMLNFALLGNVGFYKKVLMFHCLLLLCYTIFTFVSWELEMTASRVWREFCARLFHANLAVMLMGRFYLTCLFAFRGDSAILHILMVWLICCLRMQHFSDLHPDGQSLLTEQYPVGAGESRDIGL